MIAAHHRAGNRLRTIAAAVVVVPAAIAIVAFAVANRQIVTVSLDPFSAEHPAASATLPLFALVIVLLIVGVVIGGVAAWIGQSKWRRRARRLQREVDELRGDIELLRRAAGTNPASIPEAVEPPQRLRLRSPVR